MYRPQRDTGFSVAELVIAVAILFFVLTAMIGLMGASSQMTVQAKQKSVLVNAVASEIDSLRATPFDQIESGSFSRAVNGVEVSGEVTVETQQANGSDFYKRLIIVATGSLQGRTETYTTTVVIRNPDNNMTLTTDPDAPQIEFTSDAPAADEVLFGTERLAGGTINLRTRSLSPSGGLSQVKYIAGADQALVLQSGSAAVFTPTSNPFYADAIWNTNSGGLVDGFHTVVVTVEDDQGRTANPPARRRYIIDNQPALAPGVPTGVGLDASSLRITWGAARDGGSGGDPAAWFWASQYEYTLYREPLSGGGAPTTWPAVRSEIVQAGATAAEAIQNVGPITGTSVVTAGGPALTRESRPFSRFFIRVKSGRPRGIGTAYADSTALAVTRPELICDSSAQSSVAVGAKDKGVYPYTVTLNVTRPNFPHAGAPSYVVQSRNLSVAGSGWVSMLTAQAGTNHTGYVRLTGSKGLSGKLDRFAFRVLVTGVTPSGHAPGVQLPELITNAGVMPSAPSANASYNLTLDWGL